MTPEERQLVADLFDRLADLERQPRDPDAERLIREGLARAPSAVYSLVQTALVQDEALKTANDHIAQLEDDLEQAKAAAAQPRDRSFLGDRTASKWNTGAVLRGSVPSVGQRDQPMGVPPGYDRGGEPPYRDAPGGYGAPPGGGYGGQPMGGEPSRGGGFLGTAAAVAAGAIGGGLLLNGIRSALAGHGQSGGGDQGKGPFSGAFDKITGGGSSGGGASGGGSDALAREAGLGDIGSSRFGAANLDSDRGSGAVGLSGADRFDSDDADDSDLNSSLEEDFSDDAFDDDDT